jgi:hypothetical protein
MKVIYAAIIFLCSTANADQNYTGQVKLMIEGSTGAKRANLSKKVDAFQAAQSDGGKIVTKAEYLIVKEEFDNVTIKRDKSGKEYAEFSSFWESFQGELEKIKSMPRSSIKEKALRCLALSKFYKARAAVVGSAKFEGGVTPEISAKLVTSLKAPSIYFTYADEVDLINSCAFAQYHIHNSVLANGRSIPNGKYRCSGCGPFWSAATFGVVTQKLDEKTYVLKDVEQTSGMNIRNTFIPKDSYILKTDMKYSTGNAYVWALYGGVESRKGLDGFNKDLPVLYDLGDEGMSSILARLLDARDYLKTFHKGQASCVWKEYVDLDYNYFEFGCYPEAELKKLGNYNKLP